MDALRICTEELRWAISGYATAQDIYVMTVKEFCFKPACEDEIGCILAKTSRRCEGKLHMKLMKIVDSQ
jgi:hypothetical protein